MSCSQSMKSDVFVFCENGNSRVRLDFEASHFLGAFSGPPHDKFKRPNLENDIKFFEKLFIFCVVLYM